MKNFPGLARSCVSFLATIFIAACGGSSSGPDSQVAVPTVPTVPTSPVTPTANPARDITDTRLAYDVTALSGTASITFAASTTPGATLEVGDLTLDSVRSGGADLAYAADVTAKTINLALASSDQPISVDIAFRYKHHAGFQGAAAEGYTFLWPYFCGNLFPCHSQPRDGTTMSLSLTGIPAGKTALYVPTLSEAPAYQIAWSIDNYTELPLGTTTAGTSVSVWYRPNELTTAQAGTQHLVAVFDWYEKTLGAYRFGNKVGTVSVNWGAGGTGGMEHHPRWHVASSSLGSEEINAHEAAHGWFGDGVRLGCWEDFVLSEGTASYLAARALEVVAPPVGAQTWANYALALAQVPGSRPVWPRTCNTVDVLKDNLFTNAPYMRGAFFYKAVAGKVGVDKVDQALAVFYRDFAGKPARMADMLTTIKTVTGYDPAACAQLWLEETITPVPAPCT
ncbi:MAG: M1 family aminopeptidase [Betaproteobacteria bacterium]